MSVREWVLGETGSLPAKFDIWSIWLSGHCKRSKFLAPWINWNRSQIVPNRIKLRIIPTLKYFWRFGCQESKCSYTSIEAATCCILLSDLGYISELHLFADWWEVLSNHLQDCGLSHATVPVRRSGKNVRIIRFGQSLPSSLQNNQSHAAQQNALEFSLKNLYKSGPWLLMAPFQLICPGFPSQGKK